VPAAGVRRTAGEARDWCPVLSTSSFETPDLNSTQVYTHLVSVCLCSLHVVVVNTTRQYRSESGLDRDSKSEADSEPEPESRSEVAGDLEGEARRRSLSRWHVRVARCRRWHCDGVTRIVTAARSH